MLTEQEGPARIFERLRELSKRQPQNFKIFNFDCIDCISVWISLPFALLFDYWFIYWLAVAAGVIILERLIAAIVKA